MMRRLLAPLLCIALLIAVTAWSQQFPEQGTYDPSASGTNSIMITIRNYTSHLGGVPLRFKAADDNTGPVQVNVSGLGLKNLKKQTDIGLADLGAGDIKAGQIYTIIYDGSIYQLIGGALPVSAQVVALTGAYTATSSDCGKTFSLGGNAFYLFTIPASGSMPAECSIRVTNADAGRGKGVTAVGSIIGTRVLPKQTYTFINENGTWQQDPVFQVVSTNPQVYVNFIEGSDDPTTSDCLAPGAGACKTFQAAINIGRFNYWPVGINIQADCESPYDQSLQIVGMTYLITIIGNESNPSACQFNRTVSTTIFNVQDYAILVIAGFSVSSHVPTTFFVARQHVIVDIQNMIFGFNAGGSAIQAFANSVVNLTGTITLDSANGGTTLIGAGVNSRVTTNATFLVPAGQQAGYSVWFSAGEAGMIDANPDFPVYNLDARSTVTGQSYNCSVNAGIQLSTPYPPGLSPGLAITGCQATPP